MNGTQSTYLMHNYTKVDIQEKCSEFTYILF